MRYEDEYRRSIEQPEEFWAIQARLIHWHKPPQKILEYTNPPFCKWFAGGETNLCYNAIDRHLTERGEQPAIIAISTETGVERTLTYRELHREVNEFAAVLGSLGVKKGERVVIYMPNMAEAVFAVLACARLGAIHSVVFGGFAAHNLAVRIDDAKPVLLICADAGMRAGKVIPYKPLVDEALRAAASPPPHVLIVSRGLDQELQRVAGRDLDYAELRRAHEGAVVPVVWLESNEPSSCYTSNDRQAKRRARDVGGMRCDGPVDADDLRSAPAVSCFRRPIGWAVGHSTTSTAVDRRRHGATVRRAADQPDAGIWWQLCEKYRVRSIRHRPRFAC
jgi:propionyl-CoA synthetase